MKILTPQEWEAKQRTDVLKKRTRCTKYQLVNCLKDHFPELFQALITAYADPNNADMAFYWNTVQDLDRENADFQTIAQQLGITADQIDAIFALIEGEEPEAVTK